MVYGRVRPMQARGRDQGVWRRSAVFLRGDRGITWSESCTDIEQYALSDKPEKRPFDANLAALTKYPITEYQPVRHTAIANTARFTMSQRASRTLRKKWGNSNRKRPFQTLHRDFAGRLSRPFHVRYNPYTETIEVLDSQEKLATFARSLKNDFEKLVIAMENSRVWLEKQFHQIRQIAPVKPFVTLLYFRHIYL